jgi:hypothetical protein
VLQNISNTRFVTVCHKKPAGRRIPVTHWGLNRPHESTVQQGKLILLSLP